ncbi:MAG: DUF2239 family protein [Bdellovibrionota bacterium]
MTTEDSETPATYTSFAGDRKIAEGDLKTIAQELFAHQKKHPDENPLIFDNRTSAVLELDLRGSIKEILDRLPGNSGSAEEKAGPGRPKLGVLSREIGLLPRHWEWLALQPGGASVTLRKLVDEARKTNKSQDEKRAAQNATYKFMSAMAGNLPHYEEALRAFFAGNEALLKTLTHQWPTDIKNHVLALAGRSFE